MLHLIARKSNKQSGFTIVELLIVIVVIGILAAITIVAYNGITQQAVIASVSSDLKGAAKQLAIDQTLNSAYPTTVAAANNGAGLKASPGTTYQYAVNNTANPQIFCLIATSSSSTSYFITSGGAPTAGNCTVPYGLVGWWSLNGNANDTSSNNNNGTVSGATLTTGQNGQTNGAYSFNGSNSVVGLPNSAAITGNSSYAISAWIKPTAYGTHSIVCWGAFGTTNATNCFRLSADGLQHYWYYNDLNVVVPGLTDGNWHNVLAQFDGTTRSIYVDNNLKSTDAPTGHNAVAANVNIGKGNGGEYFIGSIDDVRIFNRALSANEIKTLFAAGAQ